MAVQTGTVATFFDLLTELKDFICTNQHSDDLGTGNGVQVSFSKTLSNTPISGGQLGIFFTIQGVEYLVWENEGSLLHDLIVTSSVNKATGAVSVEFTEAIDDTRDVNVIYSTGDAGEDWIVLLNQDAQDNGLNAAYPSGSNLEMIFKNSGVSEKDVVLFGAREFSKVSTSLYGWNLNSYREISADQISAANWNFNKNESGFSSYDSSNELWSTMSSQSFTDDTLAYWFFSNKRRVIVIVRSLGTIYTSSYLGAGIRYAAPSTYNTPNLVMGGHRGAEKVTSQDSKHKSFSLHRNSSSDTGIFFGVDSSGDYFNTDTVDLIPARQFSNSGVLKKTTGDQVLLLPVFLNELTDPERTILQLDGVYLCPCTGIQSEDILEIGGDDYFVFQNVFRSEYDDFTVVKME